MDEYAGRGRLSLCDGLGKANGESTRGERESKQGRCCIGLCHDGSFELAKLLSLQSGDVR